MAREELESIQGRLLATLEGLLAIEAGDLTQALNEAAQRLADALGADKVDAFVYEPEKTSLVARGTSDTPMGRRQKALGLDFLPLANGGRAAEVFLTKRPFIDGHVDCDGNEVVGLREALGVRSSIMVPLALPGEGEGVLLASSATPEFFAEEDLRFLEAVARWMALVGQRTQLTKRVAEEALSEGRRQAAEELIAVLAHDLRNLLVPLRGRIQMIRRRAVYEDPAALARHAVDALVAVDRLSRFVNDLLDVERLERGLFALRRAPVDVLGLAREIARTFSLEGAGAVPPQGASTGERLEPAEASVAIRLAVSPAASTMGTVVALADLDRLRQAVENVVGNAIRHSPPGGAVTLGVDLAPCDGGEWVVLTVTDQGTGLPPELASRLFAKFGAGPGSTGLGLGLYLAHRITMAHGGRLTVESPPAAGWPPAEPRGARFRFEIPLTQAGEPRSAPPAPSPNQSESV